MDFNEITELALSEGFLKAAVTDRDKVVFRHQFRQYCQENLCGEYNKNYSCPPFCKDPPEMEREVMNYQYVLVLQTGWSITDFSQKDLLFDAKQKHNAATLRVINKLEKQGLEGIMAGASSCSLCRECKKAENLPCPHPKLRFSCLSAYCIDVMELARCCSMDYKYENGTLYFFSAYFFNKQ